MLILAIRPTFTHPVKVKVPADNGYTDQDFRATFRVLPIEESAEYDLTDGKSSTAFLQEILVGADGVVDGSNAPLSYSDTLRDQLISLPYVRAALVNAYFAAINGAKLGN